MLRNLSLLYCSAVLALTLGVSARGQDSQDQPSLGDVARQVRSQKGNAPPQKVITNDDVSPDSGLSAFGLGVSDSSKGAGNSEASAAAAPDLDKVELVISKLDKLDRATLVRTALRGSDVDFPGRAAWEQRLVSAKQDYVTQVRDLIREARQIDASGKALAASHVGQGPPNENDPTVIQFKAQLKELMRNAVHIDAAFEAIVVEGRNRAAEAAAH